jgi:hypothetical protein
MTTESHSIPLIQKPGNSAEDADRTHSEDIDEGVDHMADSAHRVIHSAKNVCQNTVGRAVETLQRTKECANRHPVSIVLVAVVFGAAMGYVMVGTRRKRSFSERYVEEPLDTLRDAILTALSPVTRRVHQGYDAALDGVDKALHRAHCHQHGTSSCSVSDRVARVGQKLKFW